jgi:hypothetical protein
MNQDPWSARLAGVVPRRAFIWPVCESTILELAAAEHYTVEEDLCARAHNPRTRELAKEEQTCRHGGRIVAEGEREWYTRQSKAPSAKRT